jgi:hypothetical protein
MENAMQNASASDITSAIEDLINDRVIFGAYDVTKTVRANGFHVMHAEVKRAVYKFDFPFFYDRETVKVIGNDVLINLPDSKMPSEYDPDAIADVPVNRQVVHTAPTAAPVTVKKSGMFDKKGRYSVPAKVVRSAGFGVADKVACYFKQDEILLKKADGNGDKEYTVDSYGNIRIYKSDMSKSFSPIPTELDVNSNNIAAFIQLTAAS